MNYLAHLFLSGDDEHAMLGSLMGDFVRGPVPEDLPHAMRRAIELHREVDTFTDRHAVVRASKQRLRATHGPYAGIIVDVFYDHVLARDWDRYSDVTLATFTDRVYAVLTEHRETLPGRLRDVAPRLVEHDILTSYRDLAGIRHALLRISQRARRRVELDDAVDVLERDYPAFATEFHSFFPELIAFYARREAH